MSKCLCLFCGADIDSDTASTMWGMYVCDDCYTAMEDDLDEC